MYTIRRKLNYFISSHEHHIAVLRTNKNRCSWCLVWVVLAIYSNRTHALTDFQHKHTCLYWAQCYSNSEKCLHIERIYAKFSHISKFGWVQAVLIIRLVRKFACGKNIEIVVIVVRRGNETDKKKSDSLWMPRKRRRRRRHQIVEMCISPSRCRSNFYVFRKSDNCLLLTLKTHF